MRSIKRLNFGKAKRFAPIVFTALFLESCVPMTSQPPQYQRVEETETYSNEFDDTPEIQRQNTPIKEPKKQIELSHESSSVKESPTKERKPQHRITFHPKETMTKDAYIKYAKVQTVEYLKREYGEWWANRGEILRRYSKEFPKIEAGLNKKLEENEEYLKILKEYEKAKKELEKNTEEMNKILRDKIAFRRYYLECSCYKLDIERDKALGKTKAAERKSEIWSVGCPNQIFRVRYGEISNVHVDRAVCSMVPRSTANKAYRHMSKIIEYTKKTSELEEKLTEIKNKIAQKYFSEVPIIKELIDSFTEGKVQTHFEIAFQKGRLLKPETIEKIVMNKIIDIEGKKIAHEITKELNKRYGISLGFALRESYKIIQEAVMEYIKTK